VEAVPQGGAGVHGGVPGHALHLHALHIIQSSLESLVDDDGLRKVLAARFMTRKATWWMRVSQQNFGRMHQREVTDTC